MDSGGINASHSLENKTSTNADEALDAPIDLSLATRSCLKNELHLTETAPGDDSDHVNTAVGILKVKCESNLHVKDVDDYDPKMDSPSGSDTSTDSNDTVYDWVSSHMEVQLEEDETLLNSCVCPPGLEFYRDSRELTGSPLSLGDFKSFSRKTSTSTGKKILICPLCGYQSLDRSNFKRHIRTHVGIKPFSCPHCDYKASIKQHLARHIRQHTGEKPFLCTTCDYKTPNEDALKRHIRTHTGEKPYICAECDFRSAKRAHLRMHTRIHTGEKPFCCEQCDYKSANKQVLKRHISTHSAEKPFSCSQCNYRTNWKNDLRTHLRKTFH